MMRAKLQVNSVIVSDDGNGATVSEDVEMAPVCSKGFDKDGHDEDNSYARWTPSGSVRLTIQNPALFGKFKVGQVFYADFTETQ